MENNDLLKKISFFTIGRIVSTALQGSFYLIFATILEPDLYGQMSYWISLAGTFSVISRFGLTHTVTVYQAKEKSLLVNQANILALLTTSVASIALLFINEFSALLCFGLSLFLMNQHNLLGLKKYKHFMINSIIKGVLIISLPIILYFILDISGILLGMALSSLLASVGFVKLLKRKINSFNQIKDNFKIILHNFAVDASPNLTRFADKLIIVPLFGFVLAGIYQFNLQILILFEILPLSFHSFLLSEESGGESHKKISYWLVLGSILLVILGFILSPVAINSFFPKYSEGIFSLQILIISIIPISISSILNAKLQAKESTKVGYASIIRIVSLFGLIVLLGFSYGLLGLSIAVLISTTLFALSLFFLYRISNNQNV